LSLFSATSLIGCKKRLWRSGDGTNEMELLHCMYLIDVCVPIRLQSIVCTIVPTWIRCNVSVPGRLNRRSRLNRSGNREEVSHGQQWVCGKQDSWTKRFLRRKRTSLRGPEESIQNCLETVLRLGNMFARSDSETRTNSFQITCVTRVKAASALGVMLENNPPRGPVFCRLFRGPPIHAICKCH
jgi:hypothetical protein